jgi:hypothetical protein
MTTIHEGNSRSPESLNQNTTSHKEGPRQNRGARMAWISNFEEALAKAIAQIILGRQSEPASK